MLHRRSSEGQGVGSGLPMGLPLGRHARPGPGAGLGLLGLVESDLLAPAILHVDDGVYLGHSGGRRFVHPRREALSAACCHRGEALRHLGRAHAVGLLVDAAADAVGGGGREGGGGGGRGRPHGIGPVGGQRVLSHVLAQGGLLKAAAAAAAAAAAREEEGGDGRGLRHGCASGCGCDLLWGPTYCTTGSTPVTFFFRRIGERRSFFGFRRWVWRSGTLIQIREVGGRVQRSRVGRENSAAGSVRCALPQRGMEVDGLLAGYEYPIPHYYIINFFTVKAATREQLESNEKTNKALIRPSRSPPRLAFPGLFPSNFKSILYM